MHSDAVPLTRGQEAIWIDHELDPDSPRFNDTFAIRLGGQLDLAALDRALTALIERHEALRTRVVRTSDGPVQVVDPAPPVRLEAEPLEQGHSSQAVHAVLTEEARRPFDLERSPPARFRLFELAADDHVLTYTVHHLVSDGWSVELLLRELADAYAGEPPEAAPARYADFVAWEREFETSERGKRQLAYWMRQLADAPAGLALPADRTRPPRAQGHGGELAFAFGEEATSAAQRLARERGATTHAVVLGAFAALLSTYSGQDDLVIGSPLARRPRRDFEDTAGMFVNMAALRVDTSGDPTFAELVTHVRDVVVGAFGHQELAFETVAAELGLRREPGRRPLLQVAFVASPDLELDMSRSGLRVEVAPIHTRTSKFDLTLYLTDDPVAMRGRFEYDAELFDAQTAERLALHLTRLLERALERPDTALSDLDLLDDAERAEQLVAWNSTDAEFPHVGLAELVRRTAAAQPRAVALVDGPDEVTYGELVERAERVARGLVRRGVAAGDFVGLLLGRGIGQVEAMLGVLFAGAAYVPIDSATPAARLEFIVADAELRWVVVEPGGAPAGVSGALPVTLDELREPDGSEALPAAAGAAPAYCIYTSGTTGRPKGVVVTHGNVVRLVTNDRLPFEFGPGDVWSLFHSYTFDFAVWELFGCLAHGGRLVVVGEAEARDTQRFWELFRRARVTVLNQTPSAFAQLLLVERSEPAELEHLRYVVFGGERLAPRMLAGFRERHPSVALVNMYGITEVTVHASVHFVTDADVAADVSNIGVPIPTTTLHVLDRHGGRRLLPVGAVGELYVGGLGVAAGYLRRPELDSQRFVADPFGAGRLFRSGDLARRRVDGTIEFLGRADAQIKLRGYRIEPGEVEAALREHPAVAAAVVRLDRDGERLVAFVVAADAAGSAAAPGAAELRAHLAAELPDYMVPGRFRSLERLPLTPNGKLDERALWAVADELDDHRGGPPRTATAKRLAAVWAELLELDEVQAEDSFFDLGGHSLLAARVLEHVKRLFGVALPLRVLFDHPHLQELADLIDTRAEAGPPPADDAPGDLLPASSFQQRIWFDERLRPGTALYNVPLAWHIEGDLDRDELERALALVVERHEILRTRFVERDGRLHQLVVDPWIPRLDHQDLTAVSPQRRDAEVTAYLREAARRPFDTSTEPLLRTALLRTGDDEHVLFVCVHHLVWDAQSADVFLGDLALCLEAVAQHPATSRPIAAPVARIDDPRAVSSYQERIAALERLEAHAPSYHNLALLLRLRTTPDAQALAGAVAEVVERHEALSMNIGVREGGYQRIGGTTQERAVWLAPIADAGPGPPAALLEHVRRPLDLEDDALFRVVAQSLDDGSSWLALIGHLAVVDRRSMQSVARQLLQALTGASGPDIPETRYSDWWRDAIATPQRTPSRGAPSGCAVNSSRLRFRTTPRGTRSRSTGRARSS
uniref:Non-ribosomal peptide synthetase n=1 Tax=uncultured bacterium AB_162 TaxID=1630011 RepID=A0A0E3JNN4_9BACT|nr:non-ribosomal peptide synthetase [uncultured bacterium AB_162]